jgi:hypothetical protein
MTGLEFAGSAWVAATPATRLAYSLLGIFHGWAVTEHTDGTLQASRYSPVTPWPECEQDRQRDHDELTVIL